jgi:hypothetical protein
MAKVDQKNRVYEAPILRDPKVFIALWFRPENSSRAAASCQENVKML